MKNRTIQTMNVLKWTYLGALAAGLALTSCDLAEDLQPAVDFVQDVAEIHEGLEDAMTLAEDALTITLSDGSTGYLVGDCAVVTNDTVQNILTIDIGESACEGLNGIERSGKIVINYIDEVEPDAYSYSIDFQDYHVGGSKIEGLLTVDKLNRNSDGQLEFSESVDNARITLSSGKWYAWSSERTRKLVNGEGTATIMDDVYAISGYFDGADSNGKQFKATTEFPITILRSCWEQGIIYPSAGKTRIEMTGKPVTKVDWGLGFCNKTVNILQNGKWLILNLR